MVHESYDTSRSLIAMGAKVRVSSDLGVGAMIGSSRVASVVRRGRSGGASRPAPLTRSHLPSVSVGVAAALILLVVAPVSGILLAFVPPVSLLLVGCAAVCLVWLIRAGRYGLVIAYCLLTGLYTELTSA